ncbi:MAG: hypothetical protein JXR83_12650, partial [Deltaproteobacteria bacterium]|nr:hypothetical protein [Deltaproteobacteria bacterium]
MHDRTHLCCRRSPTACVLLPPLAALMLVTAGTGCQDRRTQRLMTENLQRGIAAQAEQFRQFHADPDRFVGAVWDKERILMIDAVGDCITSQRVGTMSDGGKWICNGFKLRDRCAVMAVGAGGNISFDEGMASQFGCQVHTFDPGPTVSRKLSHLA